MIADLTALYVIMWIASANTGGASWSTSTPTFLKKAQAGSASVEFGEFKELGFRVDLTKLTDFYKSRAIGKAFQLGCKIEVCDDCSINISCGCDSSISGLPIVVANDVCKG